MPVRDYYGAANLSSIQEYHGLYEREVKSLELIKKCIGAKKDILDAGCGDGTFMDKLRGALSEPENVAIWGVDYSKNKLKSAEAKGHKVKWCDLDKGLPFEDDSFDIVYAAEVIEHLYNPDYLLEECRRVLRKNGMIIVSTPNLQAWYNRLLFMIGTQPIFYEMSAKSPAVGSGILKRLKKHEAPAGHVHVFNRSGLVDILRQEGFEVTTIVGARYQALSGALRIIDQAFNAWTPLASNLIAVAAKSDERP